jgi:hypothetical protein
MATFMNSACIKFGPNAWLITFGPVWFPSYGQPVIFTSKDDNFYGVPIDGSTAQPGYTASQELWMYYQTAGTTVQNALFRWAQRGIQYDENGGVYNYPSLASCAFQNCQTGVYQNMANDTLSLTADTYCNVVTPISATSGGLNGWMTPDCGVVSVTMVNDPRLDNTSPDTNKNSQSECTFVLPGGSIVVAAFWDTHRSQYGIGGVGFFPSIPPPRSVSWATSVNSAATFSQHGPLPPSTPRDATEGDGGDPVMAYSPGGPNGTIYLLTNPARVPGTSTGFRLWTSTDKGANFALLNTNVTGDLANFTDKPMIKVNGSDLYASGAMALTTIWAAHSGNGGSSWDAHRTLDTSYPSTGTDIVIAPDGTAYVFWMQGSGTGTYSYKLRYAWYSPGVGWSASSHDFGITLNSTGWLGSGSLLRANTANSQDYFDSNGFPRVAFANGHVYVVYADASIGDRGDIWLAEAGTNADHTLTITSTRKVNNDGTTTDQWNPSIAVNPASTELFIGYYSRQNDPNNSYIMPYGAKANLANGLASATFDCIPIVPTGQAFQPLFPGTSAPALGGWAYDPVVPQTNVCLDSSAVYAGVGGEGDCPNFSTGSVVSHNCLDDYTWVSADSTYFYFAWCDRSRTFGTAPNVRPDADVKLAKIRQ